MKQNKWVTIRENSAYPDYYAGMTKHEQRQHEATLDRHCRGIQRRWKRCAYIAKVSRARGPGCVMYQLYDRNYEPMQKAIWTPDIAYSLAKEYDWTPIKWRA
jgi:hypothetical protein